MTDWGMSGRRDSYRFAIADPFSLADVGELDAIPADCSITWGYYTDNYATATIAATGYESGLVRVYHSVELPDGTSSEECLGTFFVDAVETSADAGIRLQTLKCYSTLWRLSNDALASDFVAKKGSLASAGLSRLIAQEGARVILAPDLQTVAHTLDVRFGAGENRLECANTYAGWCNWRVGVNDYGYQVVERYTPPRQRAVSYAFEDGANCVYLPETRQSDTGEVCNRVIARWSQEKPPDGFSVSSMRAVADLPAASPLSYQSAGRRIAKVLDVSPCSQAELARIASDYLSEHDAAIRYFEIDHIGIPGLRAGDMVRYIGGGESLLCEVTQMSVQSLGPLMQTQSKLKVIA